MKCPACEVVDLSMSERQGIEIDYCPKCRGVWLDRGELDKFIQQSERQAEPYPSDGRRSEAPPERPSIEQSRNREFQSSKQYDERRRDDDDENFHQNPQRPKKKESFFGNLVDFD
jgi:uncharacterized protein